MKTKLASCKACGQMIAKNAKVCPHCGGKNKKPIFKKWWFWLIVVILVASFASGGNSEEPEQITNGTASTVASNPDTAESKPDSAPETTTATEPQIVFEEIVVVDNDECTIKITELEPDNFWGYTLKVYLENKTPDKTYMYAIRGASVDGIDSDPGFATEVAPGKKSNNEINFSSGLEDLGIEFTDIEMTFCVYDSNDWLADPVALETVNVYPFGEDNVAHYVREAQETDIVLVDNEDITAIVTGYNTDSIWGYTVNLYLVNKTDTEAMFSVDEESVNGYMLDPFWATSVLPGKCKFSSMSWSDSQFEENGITEVEEIEFIFKAYDEEKFSKKYVEEVFTLNP